MAMTFRELIKSKGYSASELAREIDYTQPCVTNWVNGVTTPKLQLVVVVAEKLGVKPSVVFNSLLATQKEKEKNG